MWRMPTDATELPKDIEALTALLLAARAQCADAEARLAVRDAELGKRLVEIEHLKAILAKLRRERYGRSSERLDAVIAQLELGLDDAEIGLAELQAKAAAAAQASQATSRPPRKPAVRKPLPAHLPREVVVLEPTLDCRCGDPSCRTKIREDVTEVLERLPSQMKVIRYVRPIWACRACQAIAQAPAPDLPIMKGYAGPGLISWIAISKYCDGLPLYRLSGMLAREGVEIERAVMADWMGHVAWWIDPIVELIASHIMGAGVIHADDTPIKVLAPGRGSTVTGRLWNYVVDQRAWCGQHAPAALFRYSPDRKGERPQEHLATYKGFLHADAYAGYKELYAPTIDGLPRITHVACMAHARRYFFDAFEETKSPVAAEALSRISALYAIEAEINGKTVDVRLSERQSRAVPLLGQMKTWLEGERQRLSRKTTVAKAINYSLARWGALTRYTTDGRLAIDNNVAERALRTVAVTRKSYLFLGSDEGGRRAAAIYSIVESARLNGLDPHAYLADIIDKMAKGWPRSRLTELLPWQWKAAVEREATDHAPISSAA
jgi:transposase